MKNLFNNCRINLFMLITLVFASTLLVFSQGSPDYSDAEYLGNWNIKTEYQNAVGANGKVLKALPNAVLTNFWDWGIQTKGTKLIEVNAGSTYNISFKMKADAQRTMFLKIYISDIGTDGYQNEYYAGYLSPAIPTEWHTYSFSKVKVTNNNKSFIVMQWMGANNETDFYLDDVQISLDSSSIVKPTGIEITNCPTGVVDSKRNFAATVYPYSATNKSFSWISTNTDIAIITNDGILIPKSNGNVSIVAKTEIDEFTDTCKIDVAIKNGTYYVDPNGNNSNTGLGNTPDQAWKTLHYAFEKILAGDTLYVNDGVYKENDLQLRNLQGRSDHWTLIKSVNEHGAKMEANGKWNENLNIISCSYLEIDGFEAYNVSKESLSSGITIKKGSDSQLLSHHLNVKNCYVHDCGCGGLGTHTAGDYLLFENNILRDNAKNSEYNCSGLSVLHPVEYDKNPGYHIIIRGNVAFENECDLPFTPGGFDHPTDGNGIILDDFHFSQGDPSQAYTQKVLVENNIVFNNGGRGINVYNSDNITVRNNTSWHNMRILNKYKGMGDIMFGNSKNCQLYNNIIVVDESFATKAFDFYWLSNRTQVYNNLFIGQTKFDGSIDDKNNIKLESGEQGVAMFENATIDVNFTQIEDFKNYFALKPNSPAIDAGNNDNAAEFDFLGGSRPACTKVDMGAFEYSIEGNYTPSVIIIEPGNATNFELGKDINFSFDVNDCDGTVRTVELYENGQLVGESSSEPYKITLSNPKLGINTYFAIAIDNEGAKGESAIKTIKVEDNTVYVVQIVNNEYLVYPNPVSKILNIDSNTDYKLRVLNNSGRNIELVQGNSGSVKIDVSKYPKGLYFLQFYSHKTIITKKIIVN